MPRPPLLAMILSFINSDDYYCNHFIKECKCTHDYDIDCECYFDNNLLSIKFIIYEYMAGAAHGYNGYNSFNYDLLNGQEIDIADLFYEDADYLMALSQIATDYFDQQFEPDVWFTHFWLGHTYIGKHMYEDAIREFQEADELLDQKPGYVGALCAAYALANRKNEARKVLQQLQESRQNAYVASIQFVHAYIGLGDKEKALAHLQDCYKERENWMTFTRALPIYDSLRSEPGFQEIIRKMNFPEN